MPNYAEELKIEDENMKNCLILLVCLLFSTPVLAEETDLLQGYIDSQLFPDEMQAAASVVGERLEGNNALIYNKLKEYIQDVAAGRRTDTIFTISLSDLGLDGKTYTAEDLGVDAIVANGSITDEAANVAYALADFDVSVINSALLFDCPFDLYWYDKTVGVSFSGAQISVADCGDEWKLYFTEGPHINFAVAEEYAAGDYLVDEGKTRAVNTALSNINQIVENYSTSKDYEKLKGYNEEICNYTCYNDEAADDEIETSYGNPWQLIWVFDNDPETNVVCEGYSKAFQYLCDLSEFIGSVTCISVTGTMTGGTGAGPHMWNVVGIDGINYLVDVTNCDEGTVGADDYLFLAGYSSGSLQDGYTFRCNENDLYYAYDEKTENNIDNTKLSISSDNYTSIIGTIIETDGIIYNVMVGTGAKVIGYDGNPVDITIPNYIQNEPVIAISPGAFYECDSLQIINLPTSLKCIEDGDYENDIRGAFENCTSLQSVFFAEPSNLEYIGEEAFFFCDSLSSVVLPDSLKSIGLSAFEHCLSLKELVLPQDLQHIGQNAFTDAGLTTMHIPKDLVDFHRWNFMTNITEFTVEEGNPLYKAYDGALYYYGSEGFSWNNEWHLLFYPYGKDDDIYVIPDFIEDFSYDAFCFGRGRYIDNSKLRVVDIGLRKIDNDVLSYIACRIRVDDKSDYYTVIDDLLYDKEASVLFQIPRYTKENLVIPEGVTTIMPYSGERTLIKTIELPSSLRTIGYGAFGYSELTHIEIPAGVTDWDQYSFSFCDKLTTISIQDGLTTIPAECFSWCPELETIYLPASIENICDKSFQNCPNLKTVFYSGSIDDRENITIGSDNETLQNATWTYAGYMERKGKCGLHAFWELSNQNVLVLSGDGEINSDNWYIYSDDIVDVILAEDAKISSYKEGIFEHLEGIQTGRCGENTSWLKNRGGSVYISGSGSIEDYDENHLNPWGFSSTITTSITILEGITKIGKHAFEVDGSCQAITVILPESIREIGDYAFYGFGKYIGKTYINLPSHVQKIGEYAFCESHMESINIPASVEYIGKCAFFNCEYLETIHVDDNNNYYKSHNDILYTYDMKTLLCYPFHHEGDIYIVPYSVEKIADYSIYVNANTSLHSLMIPNKVHEFGTLYLFDPITVICFRNSDSDKWAQSQFGVTLKYIDNIDFSKMKVLNLPTGLNNIEEDAFMSIACQAVVIPDGCFSIGAKAFANCSELVYVKMTTNVTCISPDAFDEDVILIVEEESYALTWAIENGFAYVIGNTNPADV